MIAVLSSSCARENLASRLDYVGPARESNAADQPVASMPQPIPESGPVDLTITGAILMAVENNREFAVSRCNPAITRTSEDVERAAFDPTLSTEWSRRRTVTDQSALVDGDAERTTADSDSGSIGLDTFFPTGTTIALEGRAELDDDENNTSSTSLSITQSLLNGAGLGVNLASLRQARLDSRASEYELRGVAETLVADVEKTCWDYVLALRQIEIYTDSLKLAEQQQTETQERVTVGKLAETELAAARAEVALRREDLINARSSLTKTRLQLVRLLNLPGPDPWNREITVSTAPTVPENALDGVALHVAVANRMRTDLNQARLDIQHGELEVVKTRNGLLPRLDLFITLGSTGYANSFGGSVEDMDGDSYDTLLGLQMEVPIGNREARARDRRAELSLDQSKIALENMAQLVEVDVRSAHVDAESTKEQIAATAATRKLKEETLRAETEKFRVGKSTSFLVAQAQRDLVSSQISEVQAVIAHLEALVELYRLEGSLLERRGISCPGGEPVVAGEPRN
ncbi:MAG: TolC family protein [Planctomycetota bacterium]|nr:TolC family protein [Planctomycetota bacterium]